MYRYLLASPPTTGRKMSYVCTYLGANLAKVFAEFGYFRTIEQALHTAGSEKATPLVILMRTEIDA